MKNFRKTLFAAVSGMLVASTMSWLAPSVPVHAAPGDPNVGLAMVIEGQGNGHGRGLSQYGAVGWSTIYGKDWTWILDHYYGDTAMGAVPAGTRMSVRLTAQDDLQTAVIAAGGNVYWMGGPQGYFTSMVAREVGSSGGQYTYQVWGKTGTAECPSSNDSLASWISVGTVTTAAGLASVTFSVTGADDPTTPAALLLGVCDAAGAVRHYRGNIFASNGTSGENRTVNDVDIESYVRGVVPRESPASWADRGNGTGINALKAQAVAARSYGLAQGGGLANRRYAYAKTCDTTNCQVYGGAGTRTSATANIVAIEDLRSDRAVSETALMIRVRAATPLVPVSTEFSSSNGDRTAGVNFPAVDDAGDKIDYNPYSRWTRVLDLESFAARFGLATITKIETSIDPSVSVGTYGVTPAWAVRFRFYNGTQSVYVKASEIKSAYDLPSPSISARIIKRDLSSNDDFTFISDSVGASIADNAGAGELPTLLRRVFNSDTYSTQEYRCTVGNCPPATQDGLAVANALTGTPDLAIVELGYNDNQSTLGGEIDQVMTALTAKGIRYVGWVSMSERRKVNGIASFAAGNRALVAATGRWPQLRVLDWDGYTMCGPRDRWFSDSVHLNTTGQAEFALWLRDRSLELGTGAVSSPKCFVQVEPGVDLQMPVLGVSGIPLAGVTAVSLNLTAVGPTAEGYVTVWPCGSAKPETSNVNFVKDQIVPNAVIAPVDSTGKVCIASSVGTHVVVDVNGWFGATSGLNAVTPVRVFDTRSGTGGVPVAKVGALDGSGTALEVSVLSAIGQSVGAVSAVSLNVTATGTSASKYGGYVTAYPCGSRPNASNLNFVASQTVPNAVIVPVSATGTVCFYVYGQADLIADVNGWFAGGSGFNSLAPTRVFDTRSGSGGVPIAKVGALDGSGMALKVQVAGTNGVPASGAAAVMMNVTVDATTASAYGGYVTAYPCDAAPPNSSNINFVSGQTIANSVVAPLSVNGEVCFYVYGQAHVLADITGWLASGSTVYTAMTPVRFSDTRSGLGPIPGR
ncbi:MAG: SpoIID/LytB domain-containing protein [Actinomycetes bacterium]